MGFDSDCDVAHSEAGLVDSADVDVDARRG